MIGKFCFKLNSETTLPRIGWIMGVCLIALSCFGCGGGGNSSGDADSGDDQPFSVRFAAIQYRSYQTPEHNLHKGLVGLTNNDGPIQASDVVHLSITDSSGNTVAPASNGVYTSDFVLYDCLGTACTPSGPEVRAGIWINFDTLNPDTYHMEIEISNGQLLSADVDYPGQTTMPVVADGSMSAVYSEGELELSWSNPTSGVNWDIVDEIRVIIYDESGLARLHIDMLPGAESVIVPAAQIEDALSVSEGDLDAWCIQTRSIDANNMNYARGYSNRHTLP